MRVIIAITGASGSIYGVRLLEVLNNYNIETHCIISDAAKRIIKHELSPKDRGKLAKCYGEGDIEAPYSSGSFKIDAMVIIPCSMKTLAAISMGFSGNAITRAADVTIKEGRRLILVPRETPLSPIHIENMLKLSKIGVNILPAMPGFYHSPKNLKDMVDFVVGRVLDSLGIEHDLYKRWGR